MMYHSGTGTGAAARRHARLASAPRDRRRRAERGETMEKRRLGKSGLEIAPLVFGGNVFGWTADERRRSRCSTLRRAASMRRHGRRLFALGARQHRRRVRDDHRQVAEGRGNRDVVIVTKVGTRWARAREDCRRPTSCRRSRIAAPPPDRLHRPLPVPPADPDTPIEETLEAHQRLIKQGKVRCAGGSNYDAAVHRGAKASTSPDGPATRSCSPTTTSMTARTTRASSSACSERRDRRHHLFLARQRLPDRQVPLGGRSG